MLCLTLLLLRYTCRRFTHQILIYFLAFLQEGKQLFTEERCSHARSRLPAFQNENAKSTTRMHTPSCSKTVIDSEWKLKVGLRSTLRLEIVALLWFHIKNKRNKMKGSSYSLRVMKQAKQYGHGAAKHSPAGGPLLEVPSQVSRDHDDPDRGRPISQGFFVVIVRFCILILWYHVRTIISARYILPSSGLSFPFFHKLKPRDREKNP